MLNSCCCSVWFAKGQLSLHRLSSHSSLPSHSLQEPTASPQVPTFFRPKQAWLYCRWLWRGIQVRLVDCRMCCSHFSDSCCRSEDFYWFTDFDYFNCWLMKCWECCCYWLLVCWLYSCYTLWVADYHRCIFSLSSAIWSLLAERSTTSWQLLSKYSNCSYCLLCWTPCCSHYPLWSPQSSGSTHQAGYAGCDSLSPCHSSIHEGSYAVSIVLLSHSLGSLSTLCLTPCITR